LRGQTVVQIAEAICPGFPLNDVDEDNRAVLGTALTTDSALKYAIAQLDSALAHGRDSARFLNLARVLKGRALLDLGQYAAAAAAVSTVPDTFSYTPEPSASYTNWLYIPPWNSWMNNPGTPVSDHEGGNGLAFVSENDPRVPTIYKQQRVTDPTVALYAQNKYTAFTDPIVVGSGLEARLIEAEAGYNLDHNSTMWFTTLNTLRTNAGMAAIPAIPTTDTGKVNLIYHERAFWLYLTGHRLGDMRRLIRNYQRNPETVFPTGNGAIFGLKYGTATAIPFVAKYEMGLNPNITSGCTTP
jgi:hypothetical protein